jgi:hypothetical protein
MEVFDEEVLLWRPSADASLKELLEKVRHSV